MTKQIVVDERYHQTLRRAAKKKRMTIRAFTEQLLDRAFRVREIALVEDTSELHKK